MNINHSFISCIFTAVLSIIIACVILATHQYWHLSHKIFHDDTYYYIQTAFNFVNLGMMTFDGATVTNGYHPLWMWILIALFYTFSLLHFDLNLEFLTFCVIFLGSFILFLAVCQILKYFEYKNLLSRCLISAMLILFMWPTFFNGMESGVSILFLIIISFELILKGKNNKTNSLSLLFMISITFLLLSRLDSFVFIPLILIGVYLQYGLRQAGYIIIFILIGYLLQCIQSYVVIGDFAYFPQSAITKRWWAKNIFDEQLGSCIERNNLFNCYVSYYKSNILSAALMFSDQLNILWVFKDPNIMFASSSIFPEIQLSAINIFTIFIIIIFSIREILSKISRQAVLIYLGFYLTAYCLLQLTFLFSFQIRSFSWYLWSVIPFFMIACLSLPLFKRPILQIILVILLGYNSLLLALNGGLSPWAKAYQSAANFIEDHKIYGLGGTWAAGHIGFATHGKVVNLEGLISGENVFNANKDGKLAKYIVENDLKFIVYNSVLPTSVKGVGFFERIRVEPLLQLMPCLDKMHIYANLPDINIDIYLVDRNCIVNLKLLI